MIQRPMAAPVAGRRANSRLDVPARRAHRIDSVQPSRKVRRDGRSERTARAVRILRIKIGAFDPDRGSIGPDKDVDDDLSLFRQRGSGAIFLERGMASLDKHPVRSKHAELPRQILQILDASNVPPWFLVVREEQVGLGNIWCQNESQG